jgi:hypothetical protein
VEKSVVPGLRGSRRKAGVGYLRSGVTKLGKGGSHQDEEL